MPGREGALANLAADARERLDRFAMAFDRLDAAAYIQLADVVIEDDVAAAQAAARQLIGDGPRLEAVRAAVETFIDAATVGYSRRMSLTDTFLLNQSLPDTAQDRARIAASVERAVVGLVLWDELDDDHLATLIGRWAPFVDGEA